MKNVLSDPGSVDALVAAFRADPNRTFSSEETETLVAATDQNLWAAKAAALHYFRKCDFERSLDLMKMVMAREPGSESAKNIVVTLRNLGRCEDAVSWMESHRGVFDPIEYHDLLCSLLVRLGRTAGAIDQGDEALRLKDKAAPPSVTTSPILHVFDPARRERNVIAFSIWGEDPRYLNGAITNAIVARYLYPGWSARFYTDESTPPAFRDALKQHGAQVVMVEGMPPDRYGLFWRFLVEDDLDVDIFLIRDADSVMNAKERWAVADWLGSGKAFHVMRDHPQHSELILAGMWGAYRGNIGNMERLVRESVEAGSNVGNYLTHDQHFLRKVVWPRARSSAMIHDDYFSFMTPRRFSADFPLPRPMHVGQNDWVNFRPS